MTLRRRTALVALTATCAASAAAASPALAQTESKNVGVSVTTAASGARQFDVVQADSDATLSTLDLSTGAKPFRTRVSDTGFEAAGKHYSVSATMSNLYLKTSDGHDVKTKIASSQLSIANGLPTVAPLSLDVLPSLDISGTLPGCASLDDATKSALGLTAGGLVGTVAGATKTVTDLCTALGTTGKTVTGTLDGVTQKVTATVSDLAQLPNALTAGSGGAFTHADYSQDAVAKTDNASSRPAATAVGVMNGDVATALPADLLKTLRGQLDARLANTPLASADGTGALADNATVLAALGDSTLASLIGQLDAAQQSALLNTLKDTVLKVADPVLSRVKITTKYYGNPTLKVTKNAPVAGTYDGTLTLTFVQG